MKKFLSLIVVIVATFLFFVGDVHASKFNTTKEDYKAAVENYKNIIENHTFQTDMETGNYIEEDRKLIYENEPYFMSGTNTTDFIKVEYEDESQKELFDYTFENGVLTLVIKDIDLYNALESKKLL